MKMTKKVISLILASMMLLSLVACAGGGQQQQNNGPRDLEWLNLESALPIVKEGTQKTLEVAIVMNGNVGAAEDKWFYEFIEREMNINLEITKLSGGAEQLTLLFADGDLPDVIIGANVSEAQLMRYGADEGMLQNLKAYITPELTPNLYKLYSEHPEYKEAIADQDGNIWSLGYVGGTTKAGNISRAFINYEWLERAGLETPTTLDEFVDMLRAFKKFGGDVTPMGGSWTAENPLLILLNAFGYMTESAIGMDIALRNGEIVLPVADREVYGEYLKLLNQLYTEGLIHKNFFTMQYGDIKTMVSQGKTGFTTAAPFTLTSDFTDWWGAQALTSEHNTIAMWPQAETSLTCGGFVVSAKSDNVELAMRFADWFFEASGSNYCLSTNGPAATQKEYIYDDIVCGYEVDEDSMMMVHPGYIRNQKKYASKADYCGKEIYLIGYGVLGYCPEDTYVVMLTNNFDYTEEDLYAGYTDVKQEGIQANVRYEYNVDGDRQFRMALEDTMVPYIADTMLPKAYLDAATVSQLANAWTLVKEYATIETANFVIGRRPLTDAELDKYFDEIEALGATEILAAYRNYYKDILK